MHILVLGGTGQCGQIFISDALQAGHQLTLYARNPSKFPQNVLENPNVNTVKGEFTDIEAVEMALSKGAQVLVSFAGPAVPNRGMAITEFYKTLFPLLPTESSIKRCMILSTASYSSPEDNRSIKWWFGTTAIWLFGGSAYDEINGLSKATVSLLPPQIEWTLFRVPGLTNSKNKLVRTGRIGDGTSDGLTISRKSVVAWVLQELEERAWIDKAPCISNPGWL